MSDALLGQLDVVQRRLQSLERHMAGLEQSLMEAQQASSTIDAIAGEGEQDVLVPIGAGFQVRARIDGRAPVVVPLGAGHATEGDAASAKAALKERFDKTAGALRQAQSEMESLASTARALQEKLQGDAQGGETSD